MKTTATFTAYNRPDALPLLRLANYAFRIRSRGRWEGVKRCNFSAGREELVRANGFDERSSGWGFESSDRVIRLLHVGARHKIARFAAPDGLDRCA